MQQQGCCKPVKAMYLTSLSFSPFSLSYPAVYPPLAYTPQHPLSFLAPHSLTPPQTLSLPVSCSPFNAQLAALTLPGSVTSSPRQVTPFRNPSLFEHHASHGHVHTSNSSHDTAGIHNGITSDNDPLGLLSAVACGRMYQPDSSAVSNISNGSRGGGVDGNASMGSRLQERMADMRLASYHAANSSSESSICFCMYKCSTCTFTCVDVWLHTCNVYM